MVANLKANGYNFRFNAQQWLMFAKFLDFIYEQQRKHTDDFLEPVILRAVAQSQVALDRGVNASSLADALDIPRGTVRRKCLTAVKEGWLVRQGDEFRLGDLVDATVFSLFEDNLARMLSTAERVQKLHG